MAWLALAMQPCAMAFGLDRTMPVVDGLVSHEGHRGHHGHHAMVAPDSTSHHASATMPDCDGDSCVTAEATKRQDANKPFYSAKLPIPVMAVSLSRPLLELDQRPNHFTLYDTRTLIPAPPVLAYRVLLI